MQVTIILPDRALPGTGALQARYTLSLPCSTYSQNSWQGLATVSQTVSPFPPPIDPVMPIIINEIMSVAIKLNLCPNFRIFPF